jgi:hypothetical protein
MFAANKFKVLYVKEGNALTAFLHDTKEDDLTRGQIYLQF